ncbi:MAG TPA: fumarylacetoacetate hydrolase family protein [Acidimicrobiales bacterium]|nr:fumarylacetoacetate hydrolase family protein [Acidimicrobiales bacterium]
MPARVANLAGRAVLVEGDAAYDVATLSQGRLPPDPMAMPARMAELDELAETLADAEPTAPVDARALGPCVPHPAKVIGIGLNYRGHAAETGAEIPSSPLVFSKFSSALAGPGADIVLPSESTDWEVELVVVIGRGGRHIPEERALSHVAGYCIGQDVSERVVQWSGKPPQFDLGKSYDTFGPIGPALVSLAAVADPLDLAISCELSGDTVQSSRTSDMIFSVPELVAHLSGVCTLEPGDVIFTGTPAGVGMARAPARFLAPGDEVVSRIEGLGEMRNRCVAAPAPA